MFGRKNSKKGDKLVADSSSNVVEVDPFEDDPSVPSDLLDLYVHLEEKAVSHERFKEVFGS